MYKNKIKRYRKSKNMTLKDLSDRAGISVGYLSHLENGSRNNPSKEVMENIAIALESTIPEIFFSKWLYIIIFPE